jgi:hypothetical protein
MATTEPWVGQGAAPRATAAAASDDTDTSALPRCCAVAPPHHQLSSLYASSVSISSVPVRTVP